MPRCRSGSFPKRRDADGDRGTCCFAATYSSPGLIVVQVHHDAGALVGASLVNPLPLPGINELLGEAVSVFDVIPAATPKPVPGQVLGARCSAAATGGELALPAGTAHGVDHPGRAHRVGERRLPAACDGRQAVLEGRARAPRSLLTDEPGGQKPPKFIRLLKGRVTLNRAPQYVFALKKPSETNPLKHTRCCEEQGTLLIHAGESLDGGMGRRGIGAGARCQRGRSIHACV